MRNIAMLVWVCLLAGCAPSLKFGVSSTADINRNEYGEPWAVVVRIYQLGSPRL